MEKVIIKKKWNVAGGLIYFKQIIDFHKSIQNYYNIKDNLIHSVYDVHSGLRWAGGRYTPPFPFSAEESLRRIEHYNSIGIKFNITFSNILLREEDLSDPDCNLFLERCENHMNGVVVSSDVLRKHIRKHYPKFKIIASIGFNKIDFEFYQKALDLYDLVVLNPDLNSDFDFIRRLDSSRIEILVNEFCITNCPYRSEHSRYISEIILNNLTYSFLDDEHSKGACLAAERGLNRTDSLVVEHSKLNELYDIGIRHFKIQGREHPFDYVLHNALKKYVVQDSIRCALGTNITDIHQIVDRVYETDKY